MNRKFYITGKTNGLLHIHFLSKEGTCAKKGGSKDEKKIKVLEKNER